MTSIPPTETPPPPSYRTESESSATSPNLTPGDPNAPAGGTIRRNTSRFLVNKVESEDSPGPPDAATTPADDAEPVEATLPPEPITPRGVHFNVGTEKEEPTTPSDHQHTLGNAATYGTTNFKSFQAVQTVEKIPHVDHYRNIMSVQGAMAARPTLQELHDEHHDHEHKHLQHFERFGQLEVSL